MSVTSSLAYRCPECDVAFTEPGERVYECSRCGGTQVEERRCEQCHIFMAKVADESCPECEAPAGDLELITIWESEDGMVHESEQDALAWEADAPAREQRAVERAVRDAADREARLEEARLRGLEWAPRIARVHDRLLEMVGGYGPGTVATRYMLHALDSLEWIGGQHQRGELGGFTVSVSLGLLARLLVPSPDLEVMLARGDDYSLGWEERKRLRDVIASQVSERLAMMEHGAPLSDVLTYMEFGSAVHVDVYDVVRFIEEVFGEEG